MKFKSTFIILFSLILTSTYAGNLLKSKNINNRKYWLAHKISKDEKKQVLAPEMLSTETINIGDEELKVLKVSQKLSNDYKYYTHTSGLSVSTKLIKKNTIVKFTFKAMSLNGSRFLSIMKAYGGVFKVIEISDTWEKYTVTLPKLKYSSAAFNIGLVKKLQGGIQPLVNGEFLLSDLVIEKVESY